MNQVGVGRKEPFLSVSSKELSCQCHGTRGMKEVSEAPAQDTQIKAVQLFSYNWCTDCPSPLYFQVSQHKHQDNIHSSVQWKERKTGGPRVPSETCTTPDLSLNNKHSRQHGSPDQPSPFSHRNYQCCKFLPIEPPRRRLFRVQNESWNSIWPTFDGWQFTVRKRQGSFRGR